MWKLLFIVLLCSAISCMREPGAADTDAPSRAGAEAAMPTETERSASPETAWAAEYEQVRAVLDLSAGEKAELKAAYLTRAEALEQWWAEKGEKLSHLERRMKRAAKARDLAKFRRANEKVKPLLSELRNLDKTHRSLILKTLSPEHQLEWKAHLLEEKILDLLKPLELSDPQIARVRAESVSAVRACADRRNPSAAAYMKLERTVELNVLTARQREAFQEIKKQHPLRSLE